MPKSVKAFFLLILLGTLTQSSFAQMSGLFAPFDCRHHGEFTIEEPVVDTISVVTTDALQIAASTTEIIIDTIEVWRKWQTVDNFTFGKDRGEMPMIVSLEALHPFFRDKIIELRNLCHQQGIEIAIVESYRTHAKQHEYKTMGKKYTRSGAGKSKHQYGLAVDVVPIVDSIAIWDDKSLWKRIGITGEKLGLRWGGRWRTPYDPGHFEWTGGITTVDLSKGKLPNVLEQQENYPCLNEDVRELQKYWKAWEDELQKTYARR